jgi:hypothetical protein
MTAPTVPSWKGSWVCPSQNTAKAASGRHHPRSEGANPTVTAQVGVALPAMTWSAITSALSRSCVTALPRSQELRLHSFEFVNRLSPYYSARDAQMEDARPKHGGVCRG